tara:strand:- start:330 stop:767 length:438 start_codon:yes stop_codon:yes gene_type:complete
MGKSPYKMKGSPMQRNFGIGSPLHKDESKKRTMSVSAEQDLIDIQNLENAANRDKPGGVGNKTLAQQEATEKSRKRQAVVNTQKMNRADLKKNTEGSKLSKFLTSTKKLKSKATAKAYREAKGKKGQALGAGDVKDIDKYSGVKV